MTEPSENSEKFRGSRRGSNLNTNTSLYRIIYIRTFLLTEWIA
jgi:hypothetical protein